MGRVPELVFNCAGISLPGLFLEQDLKDFRYVMDVNYFGALYTSQPAAQLMVSEGVKDGRIVFVASALALFGLVGYAQYCPAKYALRGNNSINRRLYFY
jgi:NAD(P)-dependent dehydrogenase (short-subunit alcohol dehydrogenase family)